MTEVFICDGIRTPIGRYAGGLSGVRTDDLAALPIKALIARNPGVDWAAVDDIYYGCANQAGEDNRDVARMAGLLAGLPIDVPGATINRLCGSGMDAIGTAARAIKAGEAGLMLAGGVESMSRAPFVMGKADAPFSRVAKIEDTTIGWRFVNPLMKAKYGIDSMPETAENVATEFGIGRADQDMFALRSQQRYAAASERGFFEGELVPVEVAQKKGDPVRITADEHPRATSLEALAKLKGVVRPDGSVTAGNASGTNDGAAALLLASEAAAARHGLTPRARIVAMATVGQLDAIELNEAFAAQALAVTRQLGLPDDAAQVNPNGGAIALGHPLGASGARLVLTLMRQLEATGGRRGLATMCIGVGQGIAMLIERV